MANLNLIKFRSVTKAAWNALETKDANTLYIIHDEDTTDGWDMLALGEVIKAEQVKASFNATTKKLQINGTEVDLSSVIGVSDVQIDGVSIVENGIASITTTATMGATSDALATKGYVDAMKKLELVVVDVLPTASAETMDKLYLVPKSEAGEEGNYRDEFVTIRSGAEGSYTYAWEKIGDTKIDLSAYATKEFVAANYATIQNLTDVEYTLTQAYMSLAGRIATIEDCLSLAGE